MKDSGLWPVCPGKKPVMPLSTKLAAEMIRPNWGYKGPDGICSTTADLARFMIALLKGKILRPASIEAMWAGAVQVRVGRAASGWFLQTSPAGSPIIMTRGTDHGHNSIIKYYPQRRLVLIALSSSKDPDGPLLARELVDRVEQNLQL